MRAFAVVTASVVIAAIGLFGAFLGSLGCSENLHPDTTRTDVCTTAGLDDPDTGGRWLLSVFGPLLVFGALLTLLPVARRHIVVTATLVAALSIAGYAVVIWLVT